MDFHDDTYRAAEAAVRNLPLTLGGLLDSSADRFAERDLLHCGERKLSYEDSASAVARFARGLQALGVAKGDRVALLMPNSIEFVLAWFAIARLGAIEVPINTAYKGDLLTYVLENSGSSHLIVDSSLIDRVEAVAPTLTALKRVIVLGPHDASAELRAFAPLDFAEVFSDDSSALTADIDPSDNLALIYTSGTTGASKGVMISHQFACLMGQDNVKYRDLRREDVVYTCLPLFHLNAQALTTLSALTVGCTLSLGERFSASRFWSDLSRARATQFNCIGTMLTILWRRDPTPEERQHVVRLAFGAPVPAEVLLRSKERWGFEFIEGYGLTESGIIAYQPRQAPKPGSFGKAIPEYEIQIVDDQDNEQPPDVIGEIVCRPRRPYSLMSGYFNMPDKTVEAWRNLWFHTGDLGSRDRDDYLYYVDRKKDSIRRRGENVSSMELESILVRHPDVLECAVVGVPSEIGEEDIKAYVRTTPGVEFDPVRFLTWAEQQLPVFMVPRYTEVVEGFPKTPTERVEKFKLRENALNERTWDRDSGGYCRSAARATAGSPDGP